MYINTYPTHTHVRTHLQPLGEGEDGEVQYSEVRKGPRYVPKSHSESRSPPSAGPMSPQSKDPCSPGGVSELDSLLAMLNDTQISIQGEVMNNS